MPGASTAPTASDLLDAPVTPTRPRYAVSPAHADTPAHSRSPSLSVSCAAATITGGMLPTVAAVAAAAMAAAATSSTAVRTSPGRQGTLGARRNIKRDRSLQVMKAVASNNAPDVSLSDAELEQIGRMHESDTKLAHSREVYTSLAVFKQTLAKYGYRMSALHVDVLPMPTPERTFGEAFDFVLNKRTVEQENERDEKMKSVHGATCGDRSSNCEEGKSEDVIEDDIGLVDGDDGQYVLCSTGKRRRSGSNCSRGSTPDGFGDVIDEVDMNGNMSADGFKFGEIHVGRTRKRARTSQKGESCTSGGQRRLGCAVCTKRMSDSETLVRHFRHGHQELKPFSCPRCHGLYSSEGTLWHHIRNVHTETPRKYKCGFCDASYDSFGAKTRHEHATHHSGEPQFVCSFEGCGRAFNFPAHLEAHALQTHGGFRPFGCDECCKRFPSANGLTRHAREVHLRPQAYECECKKRYSKRCHLKRHLLRVHGMSAERVEEEMKKQPHPGLLHMVPRAPPACTE